MGSQHGINGLIGSMYKERKRAYEATVSKYPFVSQEEFAHQKAKSWCPDIRQSILQRYGS